MHSGEAINILGKKKKRFLFFAMGIIFIMLIVLIYVIGTNKSLDYNNINVVRKKGTIDNVKLNITYCDKDNSFENFLSYEVKNDQITETTLHNVRSTMGFSNIEPIDRYVENNGMNSQEFCNKYGFLYMSLNNQGKNYYLLQGYNGNLYYWNLFFEENNEYKIIKISEGEVSNESFQMAFKMEVKDDTLRVYLDSGLYEINSEFEVSVMQWDMNDVLTRICQLGIRPHNSKIQYKDNYIYILASSEGYKEYYVVKYDISKNTIDKYETNYCAQDIFEYKNEVILLSVCDNKVFFKKLIDNNVNSEEVVSISNLNLDEFRKNTPITKIIVKNDNIYITMSNNDENKPISYIFNIGANNYELLGFKEFQCTNAQYKIYGINFGI